MNRDEFNQLDVKDQINFVNKELDKKSLTKISDEINVSRRTFRNRFEKFGFVYDNQCKKYVLKANKKDEELVNDASNAKILLNKIEALERRIEGLEDKINKSEKDLLDLQEIKIKSLEGKTVSRCFRLNEKVQKEFSHFCKRNSSYKVQDLLGSALIEFMEKYK